MNSERGYEVWLEEEVTIDRLFDEADDARLTFRVVVRRVPREPYSWGQGRGDETVCEASLEEVRIGALVLDRKQLEAAIGEGNVDRLEQDIEEKLQMGEDDGW